MKKTIRLNESDLHRIISESVGQYLTELDWKKKNESLDRKIDRIVRESVKHVLSESDYEDYNDWAKNSNASDKEKEDAGKRQDKRREGNSFHGDKLAYKQYRHKQFDKRGEDQDNKLALKKRTAKRLRDGWRF